MQCAVRTAAATASATSLLVDASASMAGVESTATARGAQMTALAVECAWPVGAFAMPRSSAPAAKVRGVPMTVLGMDIVLLVGVNALVITAVRHVLILFTHRKPSCTGPLIRSKMEVVLQRCRCLVKALLMATARAIVLAMAIVQTVHVCAMWATTAQIVPLQDAAVLMGVAPLGAAFVIRDGLEANAAYRCRAQTRRAQAMAIVCRLDVAHVGKGTLGLHAMFV